MGYLKIPKITTLQRLTFTPYQSELIYDTDENAIYSGDGITLGGNKLGSIVAEDAFYLGSYATEATLTSAHPTAIDGNYAIVQATDTIWVWDISTSDWVDSGNELGSVPPNSVGVIELKEEVLDLINANNSGTNDPSQITITTTTSITTDTLGDLLKSQKEKNVIINNGVNAINITVNGGVDFLASYLKHGTGAITFVQGSGRTLIQVDGTNVLDGAAGSTATISSIGTTDYLRISNT